MYAILKDREVVKVDNVLDWANWFETHNRTVARTVLNRRKHILVSTVFLGVESGWREEQWFETMIFGTSLDQSYCLRTATWKEAERAHAEAVRVARNARWIKGQSRRQFRKSIKAIRREGPKLIRAMTKELQVSLKPSLEISLEESKSSTT